MLPDAPCLTRLVLPVFTAFILTACGGSSSTGGAPSPGGEGGGGQPQSGAFVDSPVSGLRYAVNGNSELAETDATGRFEFADGDLVTFYVGGVELGPLTPSGFLTPADIAALLPGGGSGQERAEVNLARWLLTLDADGDPANGIRLWPELHKRAVNLSLSLADLAAEDFDDHAAVNFARQVSVDRGRDGNMVSAEFARNHLESVKKDIRDGRFDSDGGLDSDGDDINDAVDRCPDKVGVAAFEGCPDAASLNADADGDGVVNSADNCPSVANPSQSEIDDDGRGDACDLDRDGDGLGNADEEGAGTDPDSRDSDSDGRDDGVDAFPLNGERHSDRDLDGIADEDDLCPDLDSGETESNQADADGDGTGDACDAQDNRDGDNDGVQNHGDHCPATTDTAGLDSDGCSNADRAGSDADGDGVQDEQDACPATAIESRNQVDAQGCAPEQRDSDGDGVNDRNDSCPSTPGGVPVDANGCAASQKDSDDDGVLDSEDAFPNDASESADSDADNVGDNSDNCPSMANPNQADTDSDGSGDACDSEDNRDTDGDGIDEFEDNCPTTANSDQSDIDADGAGDACDSEDNRDTDSDGVDEFEDNCPAVANSDQADLDGDGVGDLCDPQDDRDSDGDGVKQFEDNCPNTANADQLDSDGNGVGDACDDNPLFDFFTASVQPNMAICQSCHIPSGIADTDDGRGFLMIPGASDIAVFNKLKSDWQGLGGGVEANPILYKPSNSQPGDPHTGGKQWDTGSGEYANMAQLLGCWETPENCALIEQEVEEKLPLLGSARGGHVWFDYCEGLLDENGHRIPAEGGGYLTEGEASPRSDSALLPPDPRAMLLPGIHQGDPLQSGDEQAVYFNAFWKNCHIDADDDGIPENLQATAEGIITEKAHPKTCGDLRLSIARGKVVMGVTQLPPAEQLPDCSQPENIASSPYCNTLGELIRPGSTFAAYDHDNAGAIASDAYNLLFKVWEPGAQSRPANFDRIAAERYGMGWDDKVDNPYPLPGEDPNKAETYQEGALRTAKGGSGQLPVGLIQLRDETGQYSGNIGINCQSCHGITIGEDFVWGGGGAMLDLGTFGADLEAVNAYYLEYFQGGDAATDRPVGVGFGLDRVGVAGRTRGTNNAQFSNVTAAVGAVYSEGDGGSLLLTQGDASGVVDVLTSGSTATGDTPAWWNVGRRSVKFVDAMAPADAVRVDMALFFPLFAATPSVPQNCEPFTPTTWGYCAEGGGGQFNDLTGGASPYEPRFPDECASASPSDFTTWMSCSYAGGAEFCRMMDTFGLLGGPFNPMAMGCSFGGYEAEAPGAEEDEPGSPSPFEAAVRWVGENAQYADHWLMTLKSPVYPEELVEESLAETGAILFHEKDLWAQEGADQSEIEAMRAKGYTGNGSCASCHGAYSPRYVNDTDYLADPILEGIASYVTPINVIGTDRVRFDTYMASTYDYEAALASGEIGGESEGSYQSGVNKGNGEEYIFYAETKGLNFDGDNFAEGDCRAQNLQDQQLDLSGRQRALGYAAPPLYGVWATAPYLHNGSVPTIDALLNSAERPAVWRRKSKDNTLGDQYVMGYDSALSAYDHQAMGWQYEVIDCLTAENACSANDMLLAAAQPVVSELYGNVLLSWNVTTPPVLSNDDVEKRKVYNTGLHSQSNVGHTFSDVLTENERRAIIEYLKTL